MKLTTLGRRDVGFMGLGPGAADITIQLGWNNESGTSPPLWPSFFKDSPPSKTTYARMDVPTVVVSGGDNWVGRTGSIVYPGNPIGWYMVILMREAAPVTSNDAYMNINMSNPVSINRYIGYSNHLGAQPVDVRMPKTNDWRLFRFPIAPSIIAAENWGAGFLNAAIFGMGGLQVGTGLVDVAWFGIEYPLS